MTNVNEVAAHVLSTQVYRYGDDQPQGEMNPEEEPRRAVEQPTEQQAEAATDLEPITAQDAQADNLTRPASIEEPAPAEPPLPAMLVRAQKKARARNRELNFFDYLRRPFDGLKLLFWVIVMPGIRRMIYRRYGEILVEWEEGLNVLVGNKKGGTGKTPIAVLIHLVLAWLLNKVIVLLDCNPAGGHAQTREGIKKTVTFYQFLFDGDTTAIDSHEAFSELVGAHHAFRNAYCISWNDMAHSGENKKLTEKPSVKELTRIFNKINAVVHVSVMDQGNPLTGSWYEAAVKYRRRRSVPVIAFQLDQENSESDALLTLQTHIETDPSCAQRSVLVITNFYGSWWRPRDRRIRHEQIERCAYQFGIPEHRIVIIPRDPIFQSSKEIDPETGERLPKVFDPRKLRLRTLLAAMTLCVVIARTSREYRKSHEVENTQPALPLEGN